MLFRTEPSGVLAISQPTHAWISGQILRAWDEAFGEPLLLAAEQHDIGWLDWETAPSFNPETGRPHLFREIGAAVHSPMWSQGVERALGAWGAHVALARFASWRSDLPTLHRPPPHKRSGRRSRAKVS